MIIWPDADAREAFVREIKTNFSLIAPAGVGKTHSIVQRVLEIAQHAPETVLPRLVVVTYTRRAAGEMRDRVHAELLASKAAPSVFEAMDRAFFGTIHAFCARLLRWYGVYIGLPSLLEPVPHPVQLWEEFLFSAEGEAAVEAGIGVLEKAARYVHIQRLFSMPPPENATIEMGAPPPCPPELDFSELLSENQVLEARWNSRDNVRAGQRLATEWLEKFHGNTPFLPLPSYSKGGKKFLLAWEAAFAAFQQWVQARTACALRTIGSKYRRYRLRQGRLLYSDQIAFTAELLRHPRAGSILRHQNLSIILDEAQDTDPLQFEVLFEISEGRISMVGDPQQSIYGDRADLQVYREFQKRLCDSPQNRELQYQVTFRCRSSLLDFVNQAGPTLLNGENDQVEFVPLQSACEGDTGQVLRLPIPFNDSEESEAHANERVANELAVWLRKTGLEALRARNWNEVAVLCPRRRWLETLAIALRRQAFLVQIHSERSVLGDSPVYAWWTSLFWVLTHPTDTFEIAGLLRESFAMRDSDLAAWCEGDPSRLYPHVSSSLPPLQILGELVENTKKLPLRSTVDLALRKTCLLERLLSLPGEDSVTVQARHSELLIQASDAEVRGLTLREFAQELRDHFECPSESPEVRPNAIQLITCQKAKGLEWDTVVVPYFYRKISFRTPSSKEHRAAGTARGDHSAWSDSPESGILQGQVNQNISTARIQEMQRLLYVTLTRARNTLILLDDSACFPAGEKAKTFSFSQILGEEGIRAFKALSQYATTGEFPLSLSPGPQPAVVEDTSHSYLANARELARRFTRKLTPHSLAHHDDQGSDFDQETEIVSHTSGRDYGIWWHECAETLPLHNLNWMFHLEEMLRKCPDPDRGRHEWKVFSQTPLARRLSNGDYLLHTEMPFFFFEGNIAMEGIMDLAALHQTENNWLLLDWKTDRGASSSELLARYKDQLKAYARILRTVTSKEVEAGLYAVSSGQWIPLKASEF